MRLIDADAMRDGWIDVVNEPIYSANDVIVIPWERGEL